jgi:hypothetical protein
LLSNGGNHLAGFLLLAVAFIVGCGVGVVVMGILSGAGVNDEVAGNLAVMAWWMVSLVIIAFGQLLPGLNDQLTCPSSRLRAESKLATAELRMALLFGMLTYVGIMNIKLETWVQVALVAGMAAIGGFIGHTFKAAVFSLREQTRDKKRRDAMW